MSCIYVLAAQVSKRIVARISSRAELEEVWRIDRRVSDKTCKGNHAVIGTLLQLCWDSSVVVVVVVVLCHASQSRASSHLFRNLHVERFRVVGVMVIKIVLVALKFVSVKVFLPR